MPFEKNKRNLTQINSTVKKACLAANRPVDDVAILAVTKNQPVEAILPLLEAGHGLFGENRVQEAVNKWSLLRQNFSNIQLHLIGPLQTNKVKDALGLFDCIESVDRPRLVEALAKNWHAKDRRTRKILIQVNIGQEPQKSGVLIKDLRELIQLCYTHNLPLTGLMCIPPHQEDPAPHFQVLHKLAKDNNLTELSMGMSADYEIAITHGASWVRIGSALFEP